MSEGVVILTPAEWAAVRQQREEREVEELAASWLKLVSESMSYGLDSATTSSSAAWESAVLNKVCERVALRLAPHGWAGFGWQRVSDNAAIRLHWSEHPEPKAANDPGMAGLGQLVRWGLGTSD